MRLTSFPPVCPPPDAAMRPTCRYYPSRLSSPDAQQCARHAALTFPICPDMTFHASFRPQWPYMIPLPAHDAALSSPYRERSAKRRGLPHIEPVSRYARGRHCRT